jgi:hypothetical protein
MNKVTRLVMVGVMGFVVGFPGRPVALAEEDPSSQAVTQLELAQMLVNLLRLSHFVSSPATPQEIFTVLLESGIVPADGWKENVVVTQAVLACLLVQALGGGDAISGPGDAEGCIDWLRENGFPFETVGEGVGNVGPTGDPVASLVFDAGLTTDPLKSQQVFGEPDEKQLGADVSGNVGPGGVAPAVPAPVVSQPVTRRKVTQVLAAIPVLEPPTVPVTPDGGA